MVVLPQVNGENRRRVFLPIFIHANESVASFKQHIFM